MEVQELKYYNLCLPKEVMNRAKSIAAIRGLTLKEYLGNVIVDAINRDMATGKVAEIHDARNK